MNNSFIHNDTPDALNRLKTAVNSSDAIVIGAGAGLSTSAGFNYSGERFHKYFQDFIEKYKISDMYSGGFFPFSDLNTFWGWWSRQIWINRYMDESKPVYSNLYKLVKNRNYFVITTNVDHCFQKAGFNKDRLFYTQGDYGLLQCSEPCHSSVYDNEEIIKKMIISQGLVISETGDILFPDDTDIKQSVPDELIPKCPVCGKNMTLNLRSDDKFVEDETWHIHQKYYEKFLDNNVNSRILFLELGVGGNTPGIIKIPFIRMTMEHDTATYACINYNEAFTLEEIKDRSIIINDDIGSVISKIK